MNHDLLKALAAPFPAESVSWRVGSVSKDKSKGQALAYVDARDVMRRLDSSCGTDWQSEIVVQPNGLVTCRIGILVDGMWRWRQDGTASGRDIQLAENASKGDIAKAEQEHEMAQKGSVSDAFKRAAVLWGVGRYLYDMQTPWVAINEWRQIADSEWPKLKAIAERAAGASATASAAPPTNSNGAAKSSYAARKDGADGEFNRIERGLRAVANMADLAAFWKDEQETILQMPAGWRQKLTEEKDAAKQRLQGGQQMMDAAE